MKIIGKDGNPIELKVPNVHAGIGKDGQRQRVLDAMRLAGARVTTAPTAPSTSGEEFMRGFERTMASLAAVAPSPSPTVVPPPSPAPGPAHPRVAAGAVALSTREIELCAKRGWKPEEYLAARSMNRRMHGITD